MVCRFRIAVLFTIVTINTLLSSVNVNSSDSGEECGRPNQICGRGSYCSNSTSCSCLKGFGSKQGFNVSKIPHRYCSEDCRTVSCPIGMKCRPINGTLLKYCGCADNSARTKLGLCKDVTSSSVRQDNLSGTVTKPRSTTESTTKNKSTSAPPGNATRTLMPKNDNVVISSSVTQDNLSDTVTKPRYTIDSTTKNKSTSVPPGKATRALMPENDNDDTHNIMKYVYIGVGFGLLIVVVVVVVVVVILRRCRRITKGDDSPTYQSNDVVKSADDISAGVFAISNLTYDGNNSLNIGSTAASNRDETANNYEVITLDLDVTMNSANDGRKTIDNTKNISYESQLDHPITPVRPMNSSDRRPILIGIGTKPKQEPRSLDEYHYVEIPLLEVAEINLENPDGYLRSENGNNERRRNNLNDYDMLNNSSRKQPYARDISPMNFEIYDNDFKHSKQSLEKCEDPAGQSHLTDHTGYASVYSYVDQKLFDRDAYEPPNGFKNFEQPLEKQKNLAGDSHLTDHTGYANVYNYVDQELFEKETQVILADSSTYDHLKKHTTGN